MILLSTIYNVNLTLTIFTYKLLMDKEAAKMLILSSLNIKASFINLATLFIESSIIRHSVGKHIQIWPGGSNIILVSDILCSKDNISKSDSPIRKHFKYIIHIFNRSIIIQLWLCGLNIFPQLY